MAMLSTTRVRSESTTGVVNLDMSNDAIPPTLDALLSPPPPDLDSVELRNAGEADEDDFVDAVDDDARFSNVPLSAGGKDTIVPDRAPRIGTDEKNTKVNGHRSPPSHGATVISASSSSDTSSSSTSITRVERRSTLSFAGEPLRTSPRKSRVISHKKSASSHAAGDIKLPPRDSAGNLPFLLQRLDFQKAQDEKDKNRASRVVSAEEQARIQEEFARARGDKQGSAGEVDGEGQFDWDFWGNAMVDYRQFASDNPEKLAKAIEHGIPKSLRGMMWQLMAASHDEELEATYQRLLKESSPHEKAIQRDLGRTFPHHDYFMDGQGIGQENLLNVLKAYSLYDTEVGYCQGLPFVVAILLLNMPDEEAFCLLVRLMKSYGLRGHFLPEMPGLQLRLYQFDRLVEELLPVLHVHFLRQGIKSSMFCSQWFLTMFSYRFPLDVVFRIYDNVIASGIEAIFAFSVILLQKNEEALLQLKFDEILAFMKTRMFEQYVVTDIKVKKEPDVRSLSNDGSNGVQYRVGKFVQDALSLRITPFMLDVYAHEYEEMVKTRDAHLTEVDELRNQNRQLTARVNNLESSLAQLNTEHCEIVKELVMTRLRNEETESELVRYKLLYAEAMHENADRDAASSTHRFSNLSLR